LNRRKQFVEIYIIIPDKHNPASSAIVPIAGSERISTTAAVWHLFLRPQGEAGS